MSKKLSGTALYGLMTLCVALVTARTAFACDANQQECNGGCIPRTHLCILEPLPGMPSSIDPRAAGGPIGAFLYYINNGVWSWVFEMGVAIAILNGVYGGFQIVTSNGDQGKSDAGKQRFIWSAVGLAMLLLSGTILMFLNPTAFSNT